MQCGPACTTAGGLVGDYCPVLAEEVGHNKPVWPPQGLLPVPERALLAEVWPPSEAVAVPMALPVVWAAVVAVGAVAVGAVVVVSAAVPVGAA